MSDKKQQIIETATMLFCSKGFQATGIDKVIAEAGIAKMTLYAYFPTKEDLILECLKQLEEQSYNWLVDAVKTSTSDPQLRLTKFFECLHEYVANKSFFGCPFMRASKEFGDHAHPVHKLAHYQKGRIFLFLKSLLKDAGVQKTKELAIKLMLLMEGTLSLVQLTGDASYAKEAAAAARTLIETEPTLAT